MSIFSACAHLPKWRADVPKICTIYWYTWYWRIWLKLHKWVPYSRLWYCLRVMLLENTALYEVYPIFSVRMIFPSESVYDSRYHLIPEEFVSNIFLLILSISLFNSANTKWVPVVPHCDCGQLINFITLLWKMCTFTGKCSKVFFDNMFTFTKGLKWCLYTPVTTDIYRYIYVSLTSTFKLYISRF